MKHQSKVHGGIRHLEILIVKVLQICLVHGGIRHLEIQPTQVLWELFVHGGIRHLESLYQLRWHEFLCSWRHTPFRK